MKQLIQRERVVIGIIIAIIVIGAIFCSIAAWVNTKTIIDELRIIKEHLGIVEEEEDISVFSVDKEKSNEYYFFCINSQA
ncbi:hypothetical protein [Radiobacillus sp. PE A8.2]|uniref:hypothetical protein n=1 Tax=Radiobacillus sp. PE A8.2 TaxID=3380349 RepID=UPI00389039EB